MKHFFATWRDDLPASLVVFLVALPLCLGVALASTETSPNLYSGIIAGTIGGIVVGFLSASRLGVSGPAAGLITIVLVSISSLGSFEAFLTAVVLAGLIQLIGGFLGAGIIANYFPSSVVKGMLAGIGLTLILKEVPHAFGYDIDFIGDEAFFQEDGQNTISEILIAISRISPGALIISFSSLLLLILSGKAFYQRLVFAKFVPSALIVVAFGIGVNQVFYWFFPDLYLNSKHLVGLPVVKTLSDFEGVFHFPDFSVLSSSKVYVYAFSFALVASLETLLCAEATDKLDPKKQHTPGNRELKAQGIGNMISGLLGGLPITQVIVRSSANINAGGKSKLSTIIHGLLLFCCVLLIPGILNLIPFASLAVILIMVGYKLTKIELFKKSYASGWDQFIPFVATIGGVLFTNLLTGIGIGICCSLFFILKRNYDNHYEKITEKKGGKTKITLELSEQVTFLNKGSILNFIQGLPAHAEVVIDASKSKQIDYDILELIQDFKRFGAVDKKIHFRTINIPEINNQGN